MILYTHVSSKCRFHNNSRIIGWIILCN